MSNVRAMKRAVLTVEQEQARDAAAEADRQIETAMGAVFRAKGFAAVEHATPFSELVRREEGICVDAAGDELAVHDVRVSTFARMLDWIFEKGPDPRVATQRLYTLAKELRPAALGGLSHEQIGLLLGETRANGSARALMIFGGLKAAAGLTGDFGAAHKSATARAKMAESAKGNTNRRGGKRAAA